MTNKWVVGGGLSSGRSFSVGRFNFFIYPQNIGEGKMNLFWINLQSLSNWLVRLVLDSFDRTRIIKLLIIFFFGGSNLIQKNMLHFRDFPRTKIMHLVWVGVISWPLRHIRWAGCIDPFRFEQCQWSGDRDESFSVMKFWNFMRLGSNVISYFVRLVYSSMYFRMKFHPRENPFIYVRPCFLGCYLDVAGS